MATLTAPADLDAAMTTNPPPSQPPDHHDAQIEQVRKELADVREALKKHEAAHRRAKPLGALRVADVVCRVVGSPWTCALVLLLLGGREFALALSTWISKASPDAAISAVVSWPVLLTVGVWAAIRTLGWPWIKKELEKRNWPGGFDRSSDAAPAEATRPQGTPPTPPPYKPGG